MTRLCCILPGSAALRWPACMLAVAMVAGCVSTSTTTGPSGVPNPDAPSARRADSAPVRTASDQTDADRRAQVRMELAAAYFARGQNTTALDEIKQALAADPNLSEGYNLRGLVYAAMGENALAEDSFKRALQLSPNSADTLHNYGWFACQQGRFDQADAQFAAALAAPNYRGITRTLLVQGVCQARAGKLGDAERTLSRSYELDPANPATAVNLSEVLYRRDELVRARFYIKRVNDQAEQSNAQTLWLAARIEHKAGDTKARDEFGRLLRSRFPQSPEALAFQRGRFDE